MIGNSSTPYESAVAFAISRVLGEPRGFHPGFHPGGDPDTGEFLSVNHSSEIPRKASNVGIWENWQLLKGAKHKVKMAAFEGYDNIKDGYIGTSQNELEEEEEEEHAEVAPMSVFFCGLFKSPGNHCHGTKGHLKACAHESGTPGYKFCSVVDDDEESIDNLSDAYPHAEVATDFVFGEEPWKYARATIR